MVADVIAAEFVFDVTADTVAHKNLGRRVIRDIDIMGYTNGEDCDKREMVGHIRV